MSVSPLSSNSAALDLLTGGLDGSTASAALTGQGSAAAADSNFEDALFQSSDPSLSQAAYADPGLASEMTALQALADPSVTGDSLLDGSGSDPTLGGLSDQLLGSSSTVPGQVNSDVLAAYQMAGALSPDISGDDQSSSTSFDAFA